MISLSSKTRIEVTGQKENESTLSGDPRSTEEAKLGKRPDDMAGTDGGNPTPRDSSVS